MAAKKRRNKRNTKRHLHVAYTTQILNAFMNPTLVTLKSKITTYIAQEHGFSTTPTDQSGHSYSKIRMIMIIRQSSQHTPYSTLKLLTPEIFMGCHCVARRKPMGI